MKILLLGKNGQVGWELQRSLAPLGKVTALDRHSTDFCGDLGNLTGLRETVQWYLANPEWVANVQSGAYRDWVQTQYASTAEA